MTHAAVGRIGSVPYLNAVPLTWGLEGDVVFEPPSRLALRLHAGELDAALLSITEVLLHDGYDVLDGVGIVSNGPVRSVILAHRVPLERAQVVHLDTASCTSVNLLRVLLGRLGLHPEFRPLAGYAEASALDAVLLIGDAALQFRELANPHAIWDLGTEWTKWTGLPFVYAAWVLRRGGDRGPLVASLRAAAEAGQRNLDKIIRDQRSFDPALCRAYLGGNIRYRVGALEQEGVARFGGELAKVTGRKVRPVHWV